MNDLARITDTTELSPAPHNHADRIRDWVDLFRDIYKVSEALSRTAFVPNGMQGKTEDIAACIMKGFELGMDPLDSLASMYVVHGKVGVSAEFMRRRILQAGHTFKIVESTDSRAIVEAQRREGGEPHRATFTSEQARKAGIDIGKYPADKLVARATSRLCRQSFPDVLSGSLLVEDLMDGVLHDAQPDHAMARHVPKLARKQSVPRPVAADTQPKEVAAKPKDETADDLLDGTLLDPKKLMRMQQAEQIVLDKFSEALLEESVSFAENPPTLGKQGKFVKFASLDKKQVIGSLFATIEVFDRDERRTIIAHILGYALDDHQAMTDQEADTIIAQITGWLASDEPDAKTPTWADEVHHILNTATLKEEADE